MNSLNKILKKSSKIKDSHAGYRTSKPNEFQAADVHTSLLSDNTTILDRHTD